MRVEKFFEKWNGEKTKYDYKSMEAFGLPEEYCYALSVYGLPKYIEPGMNFEREEEAVVSAVEKKGYFYLGFQVNEMYICVRKKDFAIILVGMDDFAVDEDEEYEDYEIEEKVLNSSLDGLYGCLYCYYEFTESRKDFTEEEYDEKYEELLERVEQEDSSMPQYGFWYAEFEELDVFEDYEDGDYEEEYDEEE